MQNCAFAMSLSAFIQQVERGQLDVALCPYLCSARVVFGALFV